MISSLYVLYYQTVSYNGKLCYHGFNGAPLPSLKASASILIQSTKNQIDAPQGKRVLKQEQKAQHPSDFLAAPAIAPHSPAKHPHDKSSLTTPAAMYPTFPFDKKNQSTPKEPNKNDKTKAVNLLSCLYAQTPEVCHVI